MLKFHVDIHIDYHGILLVVLMCDNTIFGIWCQPNKPDHKTRLDEVVHF